MNPPSPDYSAASSSLQSQVAALGPWFHNLHLPDGSQTAPNHFLGDFPAYKWDELSNVLPERLNGWTALDIGCNAGYYSFELARRGAQVTAIDSNPHYLQQARWAAEVYGLADQIEFQQRQVYDLGKDDERYDLVLFLGVLYHLRHPLLALDIVSRKFTRMFCFQTMTMPGKDVETMPDKMSLDDRDLMLKPGWPKMAFIEGTLADDPTNYWAPNHACVEAMLRSCGLKVTQQPGKECYICEPGPLPPFYEYISTELEAVLGRELPARSRPLDL